MVDMVVQRHELRDDAGPRCIGLLMQPTPPPTCWRCRCRALAGDRARRGRAAGDAERRIPRAVTASVATLRERRVLERLTRLHPKVIDLSLGRDRAPAGSASAIPQRRLPPVVHVAGTNGKGSTFAFLRAMLEAAGQRACTSTPRRIWCASTSASGSPAR